MGGSGRSERETGRCDVGDTQPATGSQLTIDYRNATEATVGPGNGVTGAMLNAVAPAVASEHERLMAEHAAGEQRWMDLPDNTALADEISAFASGARGQYADYVLIGIGGSSLGAIATIQALANPYRNLQPAARRGGPRFFVLDNPDPEKVRATLDIVDLPNTLVNVVTKSGQTAETMANFLVARAALEGAVGVEQARRQIVATTDPQSGLLRQLADQEGYQTFPVPEGVDGRQTVLSAVGLLPAALCGIDIHGLLRGAAAMRQRASSPDVWRNPAYLLAAIAVLADTKLGKRMLVTMPYADALFGWRTGSASCGRKAWASGSPPPARRCSPGRRRSRRWARSISTRRFSCTPRGRTTSWSAWSGWTATGAASK